MASGLAPSTRAASYGSVGSASRDFSRYASLATSDRHPCNALTRILATCNDEGKFRWVTFDRVSHSTLVNRAFPRNGRAAISPDGLHYASFEMDELRIYALPIAVRSTIHSGRVTGFAEVSRPPVVGG